MKSRIHIYLPALLLACLSADSQKISKNDKLLLANLQTHIRSLSADTAGGRAMGTPGEKAVADYIISALSNAGARPKGDNDGWLQTFTIDEGRQVGADAIFTVDGHPLTIGREWFPLAFSPAAEVTGSPAIALPESGVPWFVDLRESLEAGSGNPHFDLVSEIRAKASSCAKKGATALILYNSSTRYPDKLIFDPRDKPEPVAIPVVYLTREAKQKYLKDESASADLRIRIRFTSQQRTGHNVVGFLDNGARATAVIGTRYDNNGGLAAMIELARLLAASKLHGNNYLFIVFSGSRQGWLGSDYYSDHPVIDLHAVKYLLELNRLDDLDDSHTLNIGGFSTSGVWAGGGGKREDKQALSIRNDSSATQPGDHAAFYRHRIPLLVFSTGHGAAGRAGGSPGGGAGGSPGGGAGGSPGSLGDSSGPVNYAGELQVVKFIYSVIEGADSRGAL